MENLESKIMEVLQDPEQMQQIMQIAKSLGGESRANTETELPLPDISLLTQMLHTDSQQESNRTALLNALLPYLKPERQWRLERAMQLARFSNLAELALQSMKERPEGG